MARPSADSVLKVLTYEVTHLGQSTRWLAQHPKKIDSHEPEAVLILEGGLVHLRCLIEFTNGIWITPKKGSPHRKGPDDRDLRAQDIAPNYKYPASHNNLDTLRDRIGATLSHMSTKRLEIVHGWNLPESCAEIATRLDEIASCCEGSVKSSVAACAKELRDAASPTSVGSVTTSSTSASSVSVGGLSPDREA